MTKFTCKFLFSALLVTALLIPSSPAWAIANDVNGDGEIDVVDVQCVVLTILGPGLPNCLADADAADLNCSGGTDVVDYQLIVLVVLAHPAAGIPEGKDTNGDNIHDDCGVVDPPDVDVGDIIITEIMKDPLAIADVKGEWFELRNKTNSPIDLDGWKIEDLNGESHTIDPVGDFVIGTGASAYAILGNNGNPFTACGVDVDYVFSNFTLDNDDPDGIMLVAPDGTVVDEVFYDDDDFLDIPGYAMQLHPGKQTAAFNDVGSNWCLTPKALSCEDWGAPGIAPLNCSETPDCGDSAIQFGEDCDPPGNGCDAKCQDESKAYCGNDDIEFGESCDDGNTDAGDGCSPVCQLEGIPECGNNVIDFGETCDDGNKINGDFCDENCQIEPGCGNGVVEDGEQCDQVDPPNPDCVDCKFTYIEPKCGDGWKHELEECDDGCMEGMAFECEVVVDDGDGCSWECKLEDLCGNGVLDGLEECDDGGTDPGDGCDENCMGEPDLPPACEPSPCCGDWKLDLGEACDDGNLDVGDGCDDMCEKEQAPVCAPSPCCGDGVTDEGEACDDGNIDDGDGCSGECAAEFECGNGEPEADEECDDGNNVSGDGCSQDCEWENTCGNGEEEPPETCDDGNVVAGDGCDENCQVEGGDTGTVTGTAAFGEGGGGPQNNLYIMLEIGEPPDNVPGWTWQKFSVTEFPYDYTLENVPVGTYSVYAYVDVGADGDEQENGQPPTPTAEDADGIHLNFMDPKTMTVVAGETTAGIDILLSVLPPEPD